MPQLHVINQTREEQPGPDVAQSPIANLPPETLSLIFQHACSREQRENPLMDFDKPKWVGCSFVLVLCAVSGQWRQIARSTPQLWDCIHLEVTQEGVKRGFASMTHALETSGILPLTLDFRFFDDSHDDKAFMLVDPSVDELLSNHLSRIKELQLVHPRLKWMECGPQLSQLTKLTIKDQPRFGRYPPGNHDMVLSLTNCSSLRYLHLNDVPVEVRLPPLPNIAVMELKNMPVDVCARMLFQCPTLVKFSCTRVRGPRNKDKDQSWLVHPTAFPSLRSFSWEACEDSWGIKLLRYIHLPVIERLELVGGGHERPSDMGVYSTIFSSLPSTIRTLQMTDYLFPRDLFSISFSFIDLIPSTLPIEHFIMNHCEAAFLTEVLENLSSVGQNGTSTKLFPRLKRLTLRGSPRTSYANRDFFAKALAEVRKKRADLDYVIG